MERKDTIRAQRLNEVYKHLYAHHGITSQKALADFLHIQRTGLSATMNGAKANLTDNLFKKICAAYPGVFNLNYLLTGEGELLTVEEDVHTSDMEQGNIMPAGTANILDMSAHVLRLVDDLRTSLKEELEEVLKNHDFEIDIAAASARRCRRAVSDFWDCWQRINNLSDSRQCSLVDVQSE